MVAVRVDIDGGNTGNEQNRLLSPRAQWAARLFLTLKKKCSAKAAKGTS